MAEVCWLLESRVGVEAEAAFLESVSAGEMGLAELRSADLVRMAELVRLNTVRVATLDRRHFLAVVPAHAAAFVVLP